MSHDGLYEKEFDRISEKQRKEPAKTPAKEPAREYPPEARFVVHCPSGPTTACEEHARQVRALMNFMGATVIIERTDDNAECDNCKNESR